MALLIRNGTVVTAERSFRADVYVEGESIRKIGLSLRLKAGTEIDASGLLVIPGGIDPHTHLDMPYGDTVSSDDFETGTIAAACGGTTTILDFAGQEKGRSMSAGLAEWNRRSVGKAAIDYGCHMMVSDLPPKRLAEMAALVKRGVTSFKFFTAYPDRLYLDDAAIFRGMRKARELGALILMHAENGMVIEELIAQALKAGHKAPRYHAKTRPPSSEAEAVRRTARLAELAGTPLYIVHLSCAEALEEVRRARKRGVEILAETCPQYLLLDESLYGRRDAAKYVISPPLRAKKNQAALWTGLKSRDVDCTGTDHCPFWLKEKLQGARKDFTRIPGGGPGIENRMALLFSEGVLKRRLSLNRFVEVTSTAAARIFGLYPQKGTIAVGSDADIVIFDPKRTETVGVKNPRTHHMRVDYNLYEGRRVRGFPKIVISKGNIVARDGRFVGKPGAGRFLKRRVKFPN